ncbi:hypothetical protein [Rhodococcus sp. 1168]|uniref:hypothetical protein n=1 Tax=Rhodococcus sp. 1168 TaxID=2018041 RepID=UPI000A0DEF84|nr:hypothetical protein [Rhodococcus sp. 1168]ORI13469.1 hypothetical protein BJI47_22765 [Rhodococcus sp. 1168]
MTAEMGTVKFIGHGDIYDLPPYAECDLDAIVQGRYAAYEQRYIRDVPGLIADAFTAAYSAAAGLLPILPAAAGLSGAGSPVPVSGLPTAPGTPNETRSE